VPRRSLPARRSTCLTGVARLSLDAPGIGLMTKDPTLWHLSSADNENNENRPCGEVDPFAPQPRRRKTPGSGRRKGSLNKKTLQRRALMAAVRASGESPLTFFTQLLRNEKNPFELRFAAARELMPYMHPKLASSESHTGGKTHEDRLHEAQQLLSDDEPAGGRNAHRGG
jgi:hypothetical protein